MRTIFFFLLVLLVACNRQEFETVVIRGSDTEVNLVLQLAEDFMNQHEDVSIAVTGGGSGTGIASLINKKTDIANSSRAFKQEELDLAQRRGVDVIPLVFAVDALCFITHKSLKIDSLNIAQIQQIFTGKISNWEELGGDNLPISLYGRQGNSGTFTFIQQEILKADYTLKMKQMNGTSQIIESIKQDKAGIGYVGIGYIINEHQELTDGIKVLKIKATTDSPAVDPTISQHIIQGDYPIVRPLYQYLDGQPTGRLKDFLLFELSNKGQALIANNGYFPIGKNYRTQNLQYLSHE